MTHALAVVVAEVALETSVPAGCVAALGRELEAGDQLVWVRSEPGEVDLAADGCSAAELVVVDAPVGAGRGEMYGLGLAQVDAPIVAFTDASSTLCPGWRDALIQAFGADSVCVAGGPVDPPDRLGPVGRAGFILEYGPHAVPPFRSASGDLSANNIAYRAASLRSCAHATVWKTVVNQQLKKRGVELVVVPDMRVEVTDHYDTRWLTVARARSGRLYGSQIAGRASTSGRVLPALRRAALPPVLMTRAVRVARRNRTLRAGLGASVPALALGCVAWSVGEAIGILTGRAPHGRVI